MRLDDGVSPGGLEAGALPETLGVEGLVLAEAVMFGVTDGDGACCGLKLDGRMGAG